MQGVFVLVLTGLLIAACQSAPVKSDWQPSTLREETIAKANSAVRNYHQCLNDETLALADDPADPRAIADLILKRCEDKMMPIKAAFDAEQVPASITERYMRKTRSQGAQSVLRYVMAVHAVRSANEAEAQKSNPDAH